MKYNHNEDKMKRNTEDTGWAMVRERRGEKMVTSSGQVPSYNNFMRVQELCVKDFINSLEKKMPESFSTNSHGDIVFSYNGNSYYYDIVCREIERYFQLRYGKWLTEAIAYATATLNAKEPKMVAIVMLLSGHIKNSDCILSTLPIDVIRLIIDVIKKDNPFKWVI